MAIYSFGEPLEDDILEIQGEQYRLQPFGMRAFKHSMKRARETEKLETMSGPERNVAVYALSIDLIVNTVHPDDRERVTQHIEDSVPPPLVSDIASAILRGLGDVDPTPPTSSSGGSSETGRGSTGGASQEESTPST